MSADFWAGYASGAIGIIVGNPLDIAKVRLQVQGCASPSVHPKASPRTLLAGAAAPVLGYGALNALLFVSYNRASTAINCVLGTQSSLYAVWLAGAFGGLATWVVSAPTELIKCRAQVSTSALKSSWAVARQTLHRDGVKGLYFGGVVTSLRDSIGYGFYFWSYELATRNWPTTKAEEGTKFREETMRILLCGGIAGVATWASVFPLDVIKSRLQTQDWAVHNNEPLVAPGYKGRRLGAWEVAKVTWREGGPKAFFRGLTVCSIRAFFVNAVQWAVYEGLMYQSGEGRYHETTDRVGESA